MTPAIQSVNGMNAQTEAEANAQSLNLTHIFKKMKQFPEKMPRPALIVAIDIGASSWHATFLSGQRTGHHAFKGTGKHVQLLEAVQREMARLGVRETRDVVACHEIGRDGLWVRDWLVAHGFPCVTLSADVLSGNGRTVKTDRTDSKALAVRLGRFFDGELECDHVHLPPPRDILEGREVSRGRQESLEMRTRFGNTFKSILARHMEVPPGLDIRKVDADTLRDALGRPLPPAEVARLKRLQGHWLEMDREVVEADRQMRAACKAARETAEAGGGQPRREAMLAALTRLKGVGMRTAWILAHELFHKAFRTVGQVGSATGLVAIPRCSGSSDRCAGISRRSNNRLRGALVELGWIWLRHQPGSDLAKWFEKRTADGVSGRRMRKVAVVAVARKLAVALWKFLEHGDVPAGAVLEEA